MEIGLHSLTIEIALVKIGIVTDQMREHRDSDHRHRNTDVEVVISRFHFPLDLTRFGDGLNVVGEGDKEV